MTAQSFTQVLALDDVVSVANSVLDCSSNGHLFTITNNT